MIATMQQGVVDGAAGVAFGSVPDDAARLDERGTARTSVHVLHEATVVGDRAWDALGGAAAEPNPFAEQSFVQAAAANLPQGADARVVLAWSGAPGASRLIGSFPFTVAPRYGRMPIRHVASWTHHHSFPGYVDGPCGA